MITSCVLICLPSQANVTPQMSLSDWSSCQNNLSNLSNLALGRWYSRLQQGNCQSLLFSQREYPVDFLWIASFLIIKRTKISKGSSTLLFFCELRISWENRTKISKGSTLFFFPNCEILENRENILSLKKNCIWMHVCKYISENIFFLY